MRAEHAAFSLWSTLAAGFFFLSLMHPARAQHNPAPPEPGTVRVVEMENLVEVQRAGAKRWDPGSTNQILDPGDQLRTGQRSRAAVQLSDRTVLRVGELSHLQIPSEAGKRAGLNFFRGILYFFHRDKPDEFELRTPTVSAVVRGTEFQVKVGEDDTTTVMLFDGEVEMTNQFGQLTLQSGEGGLARPNQAPERTAMIEAVNLVQWCLYYPAVLDADELGLGAAEASALAESLAAYRTGDLLAALAKYPDGRQPVLVQEKVYLSALLLSVGQVERTAELLDSIPRPDSNAPGQGTETQRSGELADALRKLIAAVKLQPFAGSLSDSSSTNRLATEWLAESYYQQSHTNLEAALAAAYRAADQSPNFSFAWARVAELEFSFGRIDKALEALEKSLRLAPRNAQALALKGFLFSARDKIPEAIAWFDRAIAVDGALGNAWLGRGLCKIRQGKTAEGRRDLQVAATVEPRRAVLRSYLAKAFSQEGEARRANKEIRLAKTFDPQDPTAWLYSALILQQQDRVNEAVSDLEKSQDLNDNRRVYRSQLLLDQDRAVRGANLAGVYQDAGMTDVSVREAARAVNADYANYSAHLFLANSYDALRDPRQVNLRYETPWLSEYLVANLLAPVGAGTLSPYVTQQEYSRLFERDRLGFYSSTEYLSRGDWIQTASQFGTLGTFSYAADVTYRSENGQRPNNDLEQTTVSAKAKQQITPQDSVYLQAIYYDASSGDVNQYYNPDAAQSAGGPNLALRTKENQEPIVLAGYHHEWGPGNHTLFLAGRLQDTFKVNNPNSAALLLHEQGGQISEIVATPLAQDYQSTIRIYTTELQQIFQREQQTVILGGRYQGGEFHTRNSDTMTGSFSPFFNPLTEQDFHSDFERLNFYGYYHFQSADPSLPIHFIAGLSYDRVMFPVNFRYAPISGEDKTVDQVSPKLGLIWTPWRDTTVRAGWSRSLGGASIDQSFQLEPSQVAGFNQAWRSIIPEAVAGANAGAKFESYDLALDQKFATRTYAGVSGQILKSSVERVVGVLDFNAPPVLPTPPYTAANSGTPDHLDYEEKTFSVTLNQLLSDSWSLGARYRISEAELRDELPALSGLPPSVPVPAGFAASQNLRATLNQVNLFAIFNHRSGFFGEVESLWFSQSNRGYAPALPGDDFWQFNAFAGYRFFRRRAEVTVGILNLTDQDYRLNPLNLMYELPRTRTFYAALRFSF